MMNNSSTPFDFQLGCLFGGMHRIIGIHCMRVCVFVRWCFIAFKVELKIIYRFDVGSVRGILKMHISGWSPDSIAIISCSTYTVNIFTWYSLYSTVWNDHIGIRRYAKPILSIITAATIETMTFDNIRHYSTATIIFDK